MIQPPCKQTCPDRTQECHSKCMRYKIYAIYMQKKREERVRLIRESADITLASGAAKRSEERRKRKRGLI